MKYDHQEARQMFPYILQLKNLQNNNLCTEFNAEVFNFIRLYVIITNYLYYYLI